MRGSSLTPTERREAGEDVTVEAVAVGGVFCAIGHEPDTEFLRDTPVELDGSGHVRTADGGDARATTATATDAVLAAGDVSASVSRLLLPPARAA